MTEESAGLPIIAFNDVAALERWLEAQPADSPGLWIKLAKAGSGVASVWTRRSCTPCSAALIAKAMLPPSS